MLSAPGSNVGNFQGVILTSGNLAYQAPSGAWQSAFTTDEWNTLAAYESSYGVRQVTFYTYPGGLPDDYGLTLVTAADTTANPIQAHLTSAGTSIFPYLNPSATIQVKYAWTYLARAQAGVSSLVETADGFSLAAIKTYPDGRQNLALTMDQNYFLTHSLLLHYGVFNWVTGGLFLGERHVYLSPQSDDFFIPDDIWDPAKLSDQTGITYRMTADDLVQTVRWVQNFRNNPGFAGWSFEYAFNGSGEVDGDPLTSVAVQYQAQFGWINHTWDHDNLDALSYAATYSQIAQNDQLAVRLRFTNFTRASFVQPDVSGLQNAQAMQAAYDTGVRYVVSDTSKLSLGFGVASKPNTGTPNALVPGITQVPRRPTNIFYNASKPAELVSEYNNIYRGYWGRDLTYAEIIGVESDNYLGYMLAYEIYPLMFHQPNSRAYDGVHSLMGDAFDQVAVKYAALLNLPVTSLRLADIGARMQRRAAGNAAGVRAFFYPGSQVVVTATGRATIPLTGVQYRTYETYGGQPIAWVDVAPGTSVTIPVPH